MTLKMCLIVCLEQTSGALSMSSYRQSCVVEIVSVVGQNAESSFSTVCFGGGLHGHVVNAYRRFHACFLLGLQWYLFLWLAVQYLRAGHLGNNNNNNIYLIKIIIFI